MKMDTTSWEEALSQRLKIERSLNFSTIPHEEEEYGYGRKKPARDPMSHRIIEKRRRDRMNNCLADLSRLIPAVYLKKGRGRIEKTEIIEMAIKHLKHLQVHSCKDPTTCEVAQRLEQDHRHHYKLGYQECMSEAVRFIVELEGHYAGGKLCMRLVEHLQKHLDKAVGACCYQVPQMENEEIKVVPMDLEQSRHSISSTDSAFTSARRNSTSSTKSEALTSHTSAKQEPGRKSVVESLESSVIGLDNGRVASEMPPLVSGSMSQLREMLQNPGLPVECIRSSMQVPVSSSLTNPGDNIGSLQKGAEEVYKFKNNIKDRFHTELRQFVSSPTESLETEEKSHHEERRYSHSQVQGPVTVSPNPSYDRNTLSAPPDAPTTEVEEIKAPEHAGKESSSTNANWDSHLDSSSSCGSNGSPHALARSSGSTSGYSTGGEMPYHVKAHSNGGHSPNYSQTPEEPHSVHSPSPLTVTVAPPPGQAVGIPIFALHPKGAFYIPLTLDSTLVAPVLDCIEDNTPLLHPVNISVNFNFCQPVKMLGAPTAWHTPRSFICMTDKYPYSDRHGVTCGPNVHP